jgi:hypothetical protein
MYVCIAAAALAGIAQAGEYHRLQQLRCSDCHTMHASRAHTLAQDGSGVTGIGSGGNLNQNTATPNPYLLIAASPLETCLACHDGQTFAPDVLGATNSCTLPGCAETGGMKVRSAGFLNEVADGVPITNYGHTLGSASTPPGYNGAGWTGVLGCDSCHAVHGSRAYRNAGLGRVGIGNGFTSAAFANVGATYTFVASTLAPDTTVDVSITSPDGAAHPALTYIGGVINRNEYRTNQIAFGQGANNATNAIFNGFGFPSILLPKVLGTNGMNTYCSNCHGNSHAVACADCGLETLRHPTTGVAAGAAASATAFTAAFIGATVDNGGTVSIAMNNAQGDIVRAVFTATARNAYEAGCLSCHKAHGNDRVFGLIFPSHVGTSTDTENGDAPIDQNGNYSVRYLCVTCHSMGRSY